MSTQTQTQSVPQDITVIQLSGRLHLGAQLSAVEASAKELIDSGVRKMVIGLEGLANIDSSGVGMLIGLHSYMQERGGKLRVAGASGPVEKVFTLVHMGKVVVLSDNIDSACAALNDRSAAAV